MVNTQRIRNAILVTKLTASQEHYLELILGLSKSGPVRVCDIAELAGVKLPSVTKAIGKLSEAGLVHHQAYGNVEISEAGMVVARSVVRRDDCLTTLLTDILKMPESNASAEVCKIEHVISQDVLLRLELLIKHIQKTPNAKWITSLNDELSRVETEEKAFIIGDHDVHASPNKAYHLKIKKSN